MGFELVTEVVVRNWLRWLRRVLRKGDGDWVKSSVLYEVGEGYVRDRGRMRMARNQMMGKDSVG